MSYGELLAELRRGRGMSQESLAEAAATSIGNVRNYEQGCRLPTFVVAAKLARALDASLDAFADCTDVVGKRKTPGKKGKKK